VLGLELGLELQLGLGLGFGLGLAFFTNRLRLLKAVMTGQTSSHNKDQCLTGHVRACLTGDKI